VLVLVALTLPLLSCYQCAIGQDISQDMVIQVVDPSCLIVALVAFIIMMMLASLGATGGGMGGRQ
jgi:hypothetical protein